MIYLDNNATTPVDPRVLQAMEPYLKEKFGNPSSASHSYGWQASMAVERARKQVAELIHADPKKVLWTSGATESNNTAITGRVLFEIYRKHNKNPHLITTAVEHKAVIEVVNRCKDFGAEVTILPVNEFGQVTAEQVKEALKPNTCLVSIIMANNELGSLNPIKEIGSLLKDYQNVSFHVDAAQACGKEPIDVEAMHINFLSLSGHKIYAPKGIGALYADHEFEPLIIGGSQERQLRSGTLNVAGIVGFGKACEIAGAEMPEENKKLRGWRDKVIQTLRNEIPDCHLNGHPTQRLSGHVSISFKKLPADLFALGLSGLAVSSGSACSSSESSASYVLKATGLSDEEAKNTIRIGFGRFTEEGDVDLAIEKVLKMYKKSQTLSQQAQLNG
ncbi:MAG: cysteine desulfurase [Bdellovibrionales bacterium]|nr:cysteine desulfurase [Bdellovibrionales bacterium]